MMIKPTEPIEKLKKFLEEEKRDAKNQIDFILTRTDKYKLKKIIDEEFNYIAKKIVKNGYFDFEREKRETKQELLPIIEVFCEKEILFFDPKTGIIKPNSRIYLKAMEDMIKI